MQRPGGTGPDHPGTSALWTEKEEIVVLRKASSSGFPLPCAEAISVTASEDVSARVHICISCPLSAWW